MNLFRIWPKKSTRYILFVERVLQIIGEKLLHYLCARSDPHLLGFYMFPNIFVFAVPFLLFVACRCRTVYLTVVHAGQGRRVQDSRIQQAHEVRAVLGRRQRTGTHHHGEEGF